MPGPGLVLQGSVYFMCGETYRLFEPQTSLKMLTSKNASNLCYLWVSISFNRNRWVPHVCMGPPLVTLSACCA